MTGSRTMLTAVAMALLCMAGLVGMLLLEGGWDVPFFLLAVLPLVIGLAAMWRRTPRR